MSNENQPNQNYFQNLTYNPSFFPANVGLTLAYASGNFLSRVGVAISEALSTSFSNIVNTNGGLTNINGITTDTLNATSSISINNSNITTIFGQITNANNWYALNTFTQGISNFNGLDNSGGINNTGDLSNTGDISISTSTTPSSIWLDTSKNDNQITVNSASGGLMEIYGRYGFYFQSGGTDIGSSTQSLLFNNSSFGVSPPASFYGGISNTGGLITDSLNTGDTTVSGVLNAVGTIVSGSTLFVNDVYINTQTNPTQLVLTSNSNTTPSYSLIYSVNTTTTAPTNIILNNTGGNVGIGSNLSPSYLLDITGTLRTTSRAYLNEAIISGGVITPYLKSVNDATAPTATPNFTYAYINTSPLSKTNPTRTATFTSSTLFTAFTIPENFNYQYTASIPISIGVSGVGITPTSISNITYQHTISAYQFLVYKSGVLWNTYTALIASGGITSTTTTFITTASGVQTAQNWDVYLGNFYITFTPEFQTTSAIYNIYFKSTFTIVMTLNSGSTTAQSGTPFLAYNTTTSTSSKSTPATGSITIGSVGTGFSAMSLVSSSLNSSTCGIYVNNIYSSGLINTSNTTTSTSISNGALVVSGGVGCGGVYTASLTNTGSTTLLNPPLLSYSSIPIYSTTQVGYNLPTQTTSISSPTSNTNYVIVNTTNLLTTVGRYMCFYNLQLYCSASTVITVITHGCNTSTSKTTISFNSKYTNLIDYGVGVTLGAGTTSGFSGSFMYDITSFDASNYFNYGVNVVYTSATAPSLNASGTLSSLSIVRIA